MKSMTHVLALRLSVPPRRIEISNAEFDAIKCARAVLLEALSAEEKFDLVIGNYADYEQEIMSMAIHNMLHHDFRWSTFADGRYLIARRLANVLAVARSYIDQIKQDVESVLGQDAKNTICSAFSAEYDKSIGYRVMEALRNYLQHGGFPIGLSFPFEWQGAEGSAMRIGIAPTLSLRDLEGSAFKSSVYRELLALGQENRKANINLFLREYIEGLNRVHIHLRELISARVEDARSEFVRATQVGRERLGPHIAGLAAIAIDDDGRETEVLGIFDEISDRLAVLVKRNPALPTLSRWYVTGEVF